MATVDKDFRVKHGLAVAGNSTFGGTVSIGTPTASDHAVTKAYVDSAIAANLGLVVGSTEPASPENGLQWLDTNVERIKVYLNGDWIVQASYLDSMNVTDHTHDTSIGGDGLITDIFYDPQSSQLLAIDGGGAATESWTLVLDGGTA